MTENNLMDSVLHMTKKAVKDLLLPSELDRGVEGERKAITIIDGYLAPKTGRADRDPFPYIVVRPIKSVSTPTATLVTVEFVIGVFKPDTTGYRDLLNVVSRLRNALAEHIEFPLDENYELMPEMTWENAEDAFPYWQGILTTVWQMFPATPKHLSEPLTGKLI